MITFSICFFLCFPPPPTAITKTNLTGSILFIRHDTILSLCNYFCSPPLPLMHKCLLILATVILMNGSWVFMGEAMQGVQEDYEGVLVMSSVVAVSYSYCLLPYYCLKGIGGYAAAGTHISTKSLIIIAAATIVCRASWYYSLGTTNAAVNSAIYQTCSAWVYVLSIFILGDKLDCGKIVALSIAIFGSIIVAAASRNDTKQNVQQYFLGYVELFVSVFCYAVFQVMVKKAAISEDAATDLDQIVSSLHLSGQIGICSLFVCPVMIFLGDIVGWEKYVAPSPGLLDILLTTGVVDCIFVASTLACIALTDPTFTSISTLLTVPLSILADLFLKSYLPSVFAVLGLVIIISGCGLYNYRVYTLNSVYDEIQSPARVQRFRF